MSLIERFKLANELKSICNLQWCYSGCGRKLWKSGTVDARRRV